MENKEIKYYEVTVDSDVYAISLVTSPAIESDFIYLSEQKPFQVCLEKDEKHLVVGAALIPDFPIYRYQNGKEFYIQFSKESIEKLAYNYLKNGYQYNTTTQHEEEANDICVVESWIKMSENDKSKDYGLDVPDGSWLVALKVENEDVWQRIKSGELKGFSVESFVNLKEINEKFNSNMEKENLEQVEINESFWDKLKSIIKDALTIPAVEETEAEQVAEEVVEDVKDETTEDEKTEEVEMEKTEEVELEAEEEVKEEATEEVELSEEPAEEKEEVNLQAVVDDLNKQIEELKSQLENLKEENIKLSKQPSVKPINSKGETSEGSNFDRMLAIMDGSAFRK